MCQDWRQEYIRCGHVSRKLINCPTYHKQQNAAKGFFGRLFHGESRRRRSCGRVVPHYADPKPFCLECIIKHGRLQTNSVGDGALRVHRPLVDYDLRPFSEHLERRMTVARRPEISGACFRYDDNTSCNHLGTTTGPIVWIPELYHNPQKFARSTSPPVLHRPRPQQAICAQRSSCDTRREEKYQVCGGSIPEHSSSRAKSNPTTGHSQRHRKPAEPEPFYSFQHRRRYTGNGSSWTPPAPKRSPPMPSQGVRHGANAWSQQNSFPPQGFPPCPAMTQDYPPLRRKRGQVFRIHPTKHPPIYPPTRPPTRLPTHPPTRPSGCLPARPPIRVPTPKYLSYLNAQRKAAGTYAPDTEKVTVTPPRVPPKPTKPHKGAWDSAAASALGRLRYELFLSRRKAIEPNPKLVQLVRVTVERMK
ncbi:hypothetical protein F4820DRAFT_444168 [Hypoxylon rubiginosum]|uniref:Uncharacterized protein n=1 Tax=Hypoxylon rubiginosum TaxID=110542 RepID=A0ACB9ZBT3_9PEZI|nr:hypothetical protein F4820DRAFT_444168 [Hypoxylon rubiginosum]